MGELHEFAGHDFVKTVDAGNTITDLEDFTDFIDFDRFFETGNLFLKNRDYFFRPNLHFTSYKD